MVDVAAKDATELFSVARKRADLSTLRTRLAKVARFAKVPPR
jgi:hypothetical protein